MKTMALQFDGRLYSELCTSVTCFLLTHAASFLSQEEIEDIAQNAVIHVWDIRDKYDSSKGASFKTWASRVVHNYAVSESKKACRKSSLSTNIDEIHGLVAKEGIECIEGRSEFDSDLRMGMLRRFISGMKEGERELIAMLEEGLSKDEIIARTGKSGSYIDTMKCRLRAKIHHFIRQREYCLAS